MNLLNKKGIFLVLRDIFITMFFLFIAFSTLELFKPQIVLHSLDLNVYFLIMLALGALVIWGQEPEAQAETKLKFFDKLTLVLVSFVLGLAFTFLTRGLGYLSILIGLCCAIITFLLVIIIYKGR